MAVSGQAEDIANLARVALDRRDVVAVHSQVLADLLRQGGKVGLERMRIGGVPIARREDEDLALDVVDRARRSLGAGRPCCPGR